MSLPDEIKKLADLKASGVLSESEFQEAKARLLRPDTPKTNNGKDDSDSLGRAANRYVTLQIIGAVFAIFIFLVFFAPIMCSRGAPFSPGFPR